MCETGHFLPATSDRVARSSGKCGLIYGGADEDEVFGGRGNDLILGGAGNDDLRGNEGNDVLTGGQGDDLLIGDNGNPFGPPLDDVDTAVFMGRAKNHTITANADGSFTVQDNVGNGGTVGSVGSTGTAGGTDTLVHVERLQFLDRLIELQAPTDALSDETTINNSAADVWDPIKRDHDAVAIRKLQDISSLLPADWDVV